MSVAATSASDPNWLYSAPHEPQGFEYWPHWPPWVAGTYLAARSICAAAPSRSFRRSNTGSPAHPHLAARPGRNPHLRPLRPSRFTDVLGRLDFASLRAHDPESQQTHRFPRSRLGSLPGGRTCSIALSERQMIVLVILSRLLL